MSIDLNLEIKAVKPENTKINLWLFYEQNKKNLNLIRCSACDEDFTEIIVYKLIFLHNNHD